MSDKHTSKSQLSLHVRTEIDRWLTRYPSDQKQSAVIEALRLTQEENGGYLTEPLMDAVADYLGMPPIAVYEVVSFYTLFNVKPVGRHILSVCTNLPCTLSGCDKIVSHLKKQLDIGFNETTRDGKFTLREVECLAACIHAPVIQVGKKYYDNLTPEKINAILEELE